MSSAFDFFSKLETEKWSGEVYVTSSQGNATLLLKEGQLIWAHRPLDRAFERLSKIEWIKLPPEMILKNIKTWEELVRMVLHSNPDRYSDVTHMLRTERLELFFRIFFWSNVEFVPRQFKVDLPDPVELGFYRPRSLAPLLKEATRRVQEWPEMQAQIGSSKRIFVCLTDLPASDSRVRDALDQVLAETQISSASPSAYSPEEIEILRLCDGTNSVQDIVRVSLDGEFLTLRRMVKLWEKGAIAPKDEPSATIRRKASSEPFQISDLGRVAASLLLASVIAFCADAAKTQWAPESQLSSIDSIPLQQALELYRHNAHRYPLSLNDLKAEFPFTDVYIGAYDYRLIHPTEYRLMLK